MMNDEKIVSRKINKSIKGRYNFVIRIRKVNILALCYADIKHSLFDLVLENQCASQIV